MFKIYLKWLAITFILCLVYGFVRGGFGLPHYPGLDAGLMGTTMRYVFLGMVLPYEIITRVYARVKA